MEREVPIMTDILIIEDNKEIATVLCDFLKKDGFTCFHVISGEQGIDYIKNNTVRLVLLDIMLPGIDGFQVCDIIHKQNNLPIIILSAKTEKDDKLNGLLLGADDYIEKLYDIDLLLAKIKALYRRHYDEKTTVLKERDIIINTNGRTVMIKEKLLNLTAKEFDLLLLLVQNKGKALRKEWIFNQVWGCDSFSEPSTLTVHIKWLREKIEENAKIPKYIQTVWGIGYKFEG